MTPAIDFTRYDDQTLSITCPVCCAAETGRCLQHKRTGGMEYLEQPHRERVLRGHGKTETDIWGDGAEVKDS